MLPLCSMDSIEELDNESQPSSTASPTTSPRAGSDDGRTQLLLEAASVNPNFAAHVRWSTADILRQC